MGNLNHTRLNIDEEIWNGLISEIYPYLYCNVYNWEYFVTLIDEIAEENRRNNKRIEILDTASGGCGEPGITLSRHGYQAWATDGHKKMLDNAVGFAKRKDVEIEFSDRPVKFSELKDFYKKDFFDLVFCVANSISHVPSDQLNDILVQMVSLIKARGIIVLDTKRYTSEGREIEYDKNKKNPVVREKKMSPLGYKIGNKEIVNMETFFTYLDGHDAIYHIELRHSDGQIVPFSLKFWRYTAEYLKLEFEKLGLKSRIISPDICKWKYEIVLGYKL